MFSMRSRQISAKLFILPVLLICVFCAIAVYDYAHQHTRVQMLGSSLDVSSVQQVLVEPTGSTGVPGQTVNTLTSEADILKLCQLLATAKPYDGNEGDFTTDIDNLLFESASTVINVPIAKTNTGLTLLFQNGHSYIAPAGFVKTLQGIAAAGKTVASNS
jgi:hypothetical protein